MIEVVFKSQEMSLVDYFQIASAVGTVAAAFVALITTLQNRKANRFLQEERHMMVKPSFKINGTFEKREEREIDFSVVNLGFNRVMNGINCEWVGNQKVDVSAYEVLPTGYDNLNHGLKIKLIFPKNDEVVKGKILLFYSDILGKSYRESTDIEINKVFNEIWEDTVPILKSVTDEYFVKAS
jgi:hypothetical protein